MMATKAFGAVIACRFPTLPVPRFRGLGVIFGFGAKMTAQRIVWYANSQIDVVLVGKLLGGQALGVYSVAYHLATLPMSKLMQIVNQVALPAYSRLQDDTDQAAEYFFKALQVLSLVFFPVMWGLSSVSDEFVDVFLGKKWDSAKIVLQIIALVIPLRVISMVLNPVINGLGHPEIGLRNNLTFTVTLPIAIIIGMTCGLAGISAGVVVGSVAALLINFNRSLSVIGRGLGDLLATLTPAALSAATMYGVVTATKFLFLMDTPPMIRLAVMIAVGAATYVAMTLAFNRQSASQSVALI